MQVEEIRHRLDAEGDTGAEYDRAIVEGYAQNHNHPQDKQNTLNVA